MTLSYVRMGEGVLIASIFILAFVLFAGVIPANKVTVGLTSLVLPCIGVLIMLIGGTYETRVTLKVHKP